jgi:deoxyribodipyrimidine photo-lyase
MKKEFLKYYINIIIVNIINMIIKYDLGIFIFRRDLRLDDNLALELLTKQCKFILPIFILDSSQIIKTKKNKYYFSENAVQFICESLQDLNLQLKEFKSKLFLFYGIPWTIIANLLTRLNKKYNSIAIGFNTDFSNYSDKRDHGIRTVCLKLNIDIIESDSDYTLRPMNELLKDDINKLAYKQYGAFYKSSIKVDPLKPFKNKYNNFVNYKFGNELFSKLEYSIKDLNKFYNTNINLAQHGGRTILLDKLKKIKDFQDYNNMRDILSYNTTNISAGLNIGCISIREAYWHIRNKLGNKSIILKQLYWRDFYLCALAYLPNAKSYTTVIDLRYEQIKWPENSSIKEFWTKLIDGKTGFLLIDAGMNELKTTGFLHNRCRLLIGVFWTKYLQIHIMNPKYGSQSGFSRYLVDAIGPSQNKMNHHWILDFDYPGKKFSAPNAPLSGRPMKIDNSMIKKWDSDCIYIKKWLPQLSDIPCKDLYKWSGSNLHPGPIFDPKEQYNKWIKLCTGI